ncbi:MAG: hypothetical protein ACR2LV_09110 [Solirubrobacteraceae bacterium]
MSTAKLAIAFRRIDASWVSLEHAAPSSSLRDDLATTQTLFTYVVTALEQSATVAQAETYQQQHPISPAQITADTNAERAIAGYVKSTCAITSP